MEPMTDLSPDNAASPGRTPDVKLDWRVAAKTAVMVALIFTVLAVPIAKPSGGNRFFTAIRPQLIGWGIWFAFLPLVFAASRRAHRVGPATRRGILIHIAAGVTLAAVHATLWGIVRWILNPDLELRPAVAAIVAFVYAANLI